MKIRKKIIVCSRKHIKVGTATGNIHTHSQNLSIYRFVIERWFDDDDDDDEEKKKWFSLTQ